MKPLSRNPARMQRSGIRMVMDLAAKIPDAIHLEVGQPDFDTPAHIIEAGCEALRNGYTKYTPNAGILSLREAIVEKLRRQNDINVNVDNITISPGAVCSVATSLIALAEVGEEVLLPDPGWPNYEMMCLSLGLAFRRYPLDVSSEFVPKIDSIRELINDRTKVIIVNSPSNPTGAVFPEKTAKELVELVKEYDLYMISDEVYEEIVFEGKHTSPAAFDKDGRIVSVFGFSKSYAMTGWRLGYSVASTEISSIITKLQEPFVSCANAMTQKAAEVALKSSQDCVRMMCEAYKRRRDAAVNILKENNLFVYSPKGAFYILVDISGRGKDSYSFSIDLLEKYKVAVAPGGTFGDIGERYVRVSLATAEDQLVEGLRRICKYIGELKSK